MKSVSFGVSLLQTNSNTPIQTCPLEAVCNRNYWCPAAEGRSCGAHRRRAELLNAAADQRQRSSAPRGRGIPLAVRVHRQAASQAGEAHRDRSTNPAASRLTCWLVLAVAALLKPASPARSCSSILVLIPTRPVLSKGRNRRRQRHTRAKRAA
jgi:hypothetical protein